MVAFVKDPPSLFILFFLLSLISSTHLSSAEAATDSISANQSLSGTQLLTSQKGIFVLGFFRPDKSSSNNNYYIGIWYKKVSQHPIIPVWVANRATPVSNPKTSRLKFSGDGNLVLINPSNTQVWSTNLTTSKSKTIPVPVAAVLLDTGNFVLRDASSNSSNKVLWQSIDHPTDTWLPGGKLGLNKLTGQSQRLTSWKNSADPTPGIFSLELDPNGTNQYIIQWNNTVNYWSTGTWNGRDMFSGVPEMTRTSMFDFKYITNDQESYFTYSINKNYRDIISPFIMDVSGQIRHLAWVENSQQWTLFGSQPRAQCDVYALCGAFGSCNENKLPSCNCVQGFSQRFPSDWELSDRTGGCVRNTRLHCEAVDDDKADKFLTMTNMKLPENPHVSLKVGLGIADYDCETACLTNCSCTAYSSTTDGGCSLWYGDLMNLRELSGGSGNDILYLRLAASEFSSRKSNYKRMMIARVVASVGGVGLFALIAIVAWVLVWRGPRRGRLNRASKKTLRGGLVSFRYIDLLRATNNFSDKLGRGGFGSVFKGTLPDSTAIAVKMLEGLRQGEKQFRAEVSTIGTIHHVNLIRLRGFCSGGDNKKLLVYDYMPKSSLDTRLFKGNSTTVLDWSTRYQIAIGIARGLAYLHEKCRECIIHCDIKPENILLDDSFVPKVADFGLAKLLGRDFSRVLTTMRGTRGYLAPEWISGVAITAKADVYSYGMMLFEIISGRRNSEQLEGEQNSFFPKLAAAKLMEGDILGLLDPRLAGYANLEELGRACKVACWCIQDDENSRLSMGQVTQILEGVLEVGMPPTPRSLQIFGDNEENIVFFSDLSSDQCSQKRSTTSTSSHAKTISSASSRE